MEKRKKQIKIALWIVGIIILIVVLTGPYGIYQRIMIAGQKHQLETQIEKLTREQELLNTERERLKWDLTYIEKVAREKYSLVRPGEHVYQFIPRTQQTAESGK
jgi:cell division protein FtsB